MKPAKIGRPAMADAEKHGKITAVRLREEERGLLEQAAANHGQKLSDWMRETLIGSAKRQLRAS